MRRDVTSRNVMRRNAIKRDVSKPDHDVGLRQAITRIVCLAAIAVSTRAMAADEALRWRGDVDGGANKSFRPIVFVHGFAGSGEQYERPAKLFESNGYPPTWINVYDYNSMGPSGGAEPLDKFIDAVRARTGFDKIDLVGHSRGTGVSKDYLSDPKRKAESRITRTSRDGRPATKEACRPSLSDQRGTKLLAPERRERARNTSCSRSRTTSARQRAPNRSRRCSRSSTAAKRPNARRSTTGADCRRRFRQNLRPQLAARGGDRGRLRDCGRHRPSPARAGGCALHRGEGRPLGPVPCPAGPAL